MGHRFAILMAHVGALRPFGAPAPVNYFVRLSNLALPMNKLSSGSVGEYVGKKFEEYKKKHKGN